MVDVKQAPEAPRLKNLALVLSVTGQDPTLTISLLVAANST